MQLNGVDLKDATLTNTYDYIRNNPRHTYQRMQDITGQKLANAQPMMQQPMPGVPSAGSTASAWNQLENNK